MVSITDDFLLTPIPVRMLPDGRMDPANAAAYLGVSIKTMANWRSKGIGPPFCKRGRIFYYRQDLDDWLAGGLAQSAAQARFKNGGFLA